MSVQAITCALALRGVSSSEKLLLLALANYADENMQCWPSQSRLAADTCLSARTVRSLLAGLEERRVVSRMARERADGSRTSDLITLHFAGQVVTQISGGAEMVSGGVGKPLPGGAEMVSGLTTFEPSVEPSEEPIIAAKRRVDVPDFDQFWSAYPHKVAKADARRAWRKTRGVPLATILAALETYKRTKPEDRAWCNPATWINGGRWEDEPPAAAGQDPPKTYQFDPEAHARRVAMIEASLSESPPCQSSQ